jgi:hypothetical protein
MRTGDKMGFNIGAKSEWGWLFAMLASDPVLSCWKHGTNLLLASCGSQ